MPITSWLFTCMLTYININQYEVQFNDCGGIFLSLLSFLDKNLCEKKKKHFVRPTPSPEAFCIAIRLHKLTIYAFILQYWF